VLVPDDEIPPWNNRKQPASSARPPKQASPVATPPASLYVVFVYLVAGPTSEKFSNKQISRVIEIRGDQTLEQLHHAIFKAYDRSDDHAYEFQFGKRPHDPDGPDYGVPVPGKRKKGYGDARTTKLDELNLKLHRAFGYWFDFGDNWYHQVQVEKIELAIPTVTYPRVIKRVGKSPPQYDGELSFRSARQKHRSAGQKH
jgi:Plasmid pRiA4b ORF-3-like protein